MARPGTLPFRWLLLVLAALAPGCRDPNPTFVFDAATIPVDAGTPDVARFDAAGSNLPDGAAGAEGGSPP